MISVHSFTPKPELGDARSVDIGLLVKHDVESAEQFRKMWARDYNVGMNEPYSAYDLNHTIDANVALRGLRHLAIEIRQDHISTDIKAREMAQLLAEHLEPLVNRRRIDSIRP